MHRFNNKHSMMLRIFNAGLTGRSFLKNCSFHNVRVIIPPARVGNGRTSTPLPYPSHRRFSSVPATKPKSKKKTPKKTESKVEDESRLFLERTAEMSGLDDVPAQAMKEDEFDLEEESLLKEDNLELFREIANGDGHIYKLLRELQVRLDMTACYYGVKLNITKEDWLELLSSSQSKRKGFVAYWILNELREIKRRKGQGLVLYDLPDSDDEDDGSQSSLEYDVRCYHLFHNVMFLKMREAAIKKMHYSKAFTAMIHSSCLVYDCSYNHLMTNLEVKELARQLVASMGINCKNPQPYHVILCNFNKDDKLGELLQKYNPLLLRSDYPVTITEKSYLDLFPSSNLVYLTPHCRTSLKCYDPNVTYIVGAFVDKTVRKPVSLAKAKEEKLAMARLPLDEYLNWGHGNKCLSLPHVTSIMLNMRLYNGNWPKAFEIIPKRFLDKSKITSMKKTFDNRVISRFSTSQLLREGN